MNSARSSIPLSRLVENVFSAKPLPPKVKNHLIQVYALLSVGLFVFAFSSIMFPFAETIHRSSILRFFLAIAAIVNLVALMMTDKLNQVKKAALFVSASALLGVGSSMVLQHLLNELPEVLLQAVVYTAATFVSFAAVAIFTQRRTFLFLLPLLLMFTNIFLTLSFFGYFYGYRPENSLFILFVMLVVEWGYVVYDTQFVIEKAMNGNYDVAMDAMVFLLDVINIFFKIIQILIKMQDNKKKE